MSQNKEKIDNLWKANAPLTSMPDFDSFWRECIEHSNKIPLNADMKCIASDSDNYIAYDVYFDGCDGSRIHGMLARPSQIDRQIPVMLHFHGFGGNAGLPEEFKDFLDLNICVLSIDIRGQSGISENIYKYSSGTQGELMTLGALSKDEYYYKWVMLDCIRALDFACTLDYTDKNMIIAEGGSQGGAITLLLTALDSRVRYCLCDVPSNCDIYSRIEGRFGSFAQVSEYILQNPGTKEAVYTTMSYFDVINAAGKISVPVFASVGLLDDICPAEFFFSAYNKISSEKQVFIYEEAGHDGGGEIHRERKINYLKAAISF